MRKERSRGKTRAQLQSRYAGQSFSVFTSSTVPWHHDCSFSSEMRHGGMRRARRIFARDAVIPYLLPYIGIPLRELRAMIAASVFQSDREFALPHGFPWELLGKPARVFRAPFPLHIRRGRITPVIRFASRDQAPRCVYEVTRRVTQKNGC